MSHSQFPERARLSPLNPQKRLIRLRCVAFQVGWLKADTKAIQAVGDSVITHNPRVSVSHEKLQMHKLHITDVQLDDEGVYMCQLNTDPMKSQVRGARSLAREARARSFIWRAPRR